jgi:hypothetical protein
VYGGRSVQIYLLREKLIVVMVKLWGILVTSAINQIACNVKLVHENHLAVLEKYINLSIYFRNY